MVVASVNIIKQRKITYPKVIEHWHLLDSFLQEFRIEHDICYLELGSFHANLRIMKTGKVLNIKAKASKICT
jgi:hypothetical protein